MMKRYIILIFIVALMSSCNNDIYDNIKEYVDSEIVYPAGYDQANVVLKAGFERVEIDLMEDRNNVPYLPKAKKTVVEYGDTSLIFTPARSWVNVTGLTIPQTYNFKIFTEDEFGNRSAPVEIKGRPLTDTDKSSWVIANIKYLSYIGYVYIYPSLSPEIYDISSIEYSFNDGSKLRTGTQAGNILFLDSLQPINQSLNVNLTFHIVPIGAIDEVTTTTELKIETVDWDTYIDKTIFKLRTSIDITKEAPYVLFAADFDLGGPDVAFYRIRPAWGLEELHNLDLNYRPSGGDAEMNYGIHKGAEATGMRGVAWTGNGCWYDYTVNVVDPGVYKLRINSAISATSGRAQLALDDNDLLGVITIANNGNWSRFDWFDPNLTIRLPAGLHKFRYTVYREHNFGGLEFTYVEP